MALIMRLLKKDGRAAVVLPDGFLFGEGMKIGLKKKLLTECNLHTIVRLPNGVFSPYTGIKTNLLFFTKGTPTETIWYYEHPYPDGVKNYNKTKPMRFAEFQPEINWWENRKETEQAWQINFAELKANAESRARVHWQRAESLKQQATALNSNIKSLAKDAPDGELGSLKQQLDNLSQQAKEQQQTGDGIYNAIFNLDCKNPHKLELFSHDPEDLLKQYAEQQQAIAELRQQLKMILNAALS